MTQIAIFVREAPQNKTQVNTLNCGSLVVSVPADDGAHVSLHFDTPRDLQKWLMLVSTAARAAK